MCMYVCDIYVVCATVLYVHIIIYNYVCILCMYVYNIMYICMYVCMYVYMYVCMCMYICMYVCI